MDNSSEMYRQFTLRIQKDLDGWKQRHQQQKRELEDYQSILTLVNNYATQSKMQVDIGSNFFMQATTNQSRKLILKASRDIFIQMSYSEATKIIPNLIKNAKIKLSTSEKEIALIESSREQIQLTLQKYSAIS